MGKFCVSYLCVWFQGLFIFFIIVVSLVSASLIGFLIFLIVSSWVKGNWNLAKRFSEDKDAKEKRLKEQEVEEKLKDREEYGYCVGDEAKYICENSDASNRRRFGQKCKILEIDRKGDIYPGWEDGTEGGVGGGTNEGYINNSSFKITKKQKLAGAK